MLKFIRKTIDGVEEEMKFIKEKDFKAVEKVMAKRGFTEKSED